MSTSAFKSDDILRRTQAVGAYYGFTPLTALASKNRGNGTRGPYPESLVLEGMDAPARETMGLLKQLRDAGITPTKAEPVFVWHTNAAAGRPAPKNIVIQFHILGVDHAIGDAVLIRAMRALMSDLTKTEATLRINSMGDKETRSRFARELGQFFRKHAANLPEHCVSCSRTDVFQAAELLADAKEAVEHLPSPTDHLSEASRKHFEGVLDYLETTDTPYELAPNLLSRGTNWTETCFEIRTPHAHTPLHTWGARYQDITKHFWKSGVPSIGAVLRFSLTDRSTIPPIKERTQPRFVFVHIGEEAKRESMKMADAFRHARIPLTQAIGIESLSEQMRYVETVNPPYVLIMGRKEALERSVILRERSSYSESLIPLDSLIDRLKGVS